QRRWHRFSTRDSLAYAVPTIGRAACIDVVGGHGARESLISVDGRANAFAHPTRATAVRLQITKRKSSPVCCFGPGGRPHSPSSPSLELEGVGAPTRRSARIAPGGCPDCSGRRSAALWHG